MNSLRKVIICLLLPLIFSANAQQNQPNDSLTRIAEIQYNIKKNTVDFEPKTPALNPIAGAPAPFYDYFWEFGDGGYSTEKEPKHTYKDKGYYDIRLWATNNYDTGKPPTTRPQSIFITNDTTLENSTSSTTMTENFILKSNRDPIPNESIVVVMSYKNIKDHMTNGKLYVFYNEQKYKANNFSLNEVRTYHGEQTLNEENAYAYTYNHDDYNFLYAATNNNLTYSLPPEDSTERKNLSQTISNAKETYKNWEAFRFDGINPNEERNLFFDFRTTPEMLKDTSATITIRGVYVPDDNYDNHRVKDIEMEIVTSHDPNKMSSNGAFINFRRTKKPVTYKVKFQNNGEGPATTIRLESDIPDLFDKKTLQIKGMYPKCKICPEEKVDYSCLDTTFTDTQVIFTFRNIYLPGSRQKGIHDKDSTKGYVKYSMLFGKKLRKQKTKSKTAIIFDKNEPIITNRSATRFFPGISIGAKIGYNYFPKLDSSSSYSIGATLSPYRSYRWYWQVELMSNFHTYKDKTIVKEEIISINQADRFQRTTTSSSYQNVNINIPILLRYNINDYVGIGIGLQSAISASEKQTQSTLTELYETKQGRFLVESQNASDNNTESLTNIRTGLLFDITLGSVRVGPSVGARYTLASEQKYNYWNFYAIWKF